MGYGGYAEIWAIEEQATSSQDTSDKQASYKLSLERE
jgi:hypothetical protein